MRNTMGTMGGRTVEGVEPELDDVADEDEFGDALLGTELGELIKELARNGVALERTVMRTKRWSMRDRRTDH